MTLRRQTGSVLIVAMWTIVALTGLVLTLAFSMRSEAIAGANRLAQAKAEAALRGAEQFVIMAVDNEMATPGYLSSLSMEARMVGDSYVWVVRPDWDNDGQLTYGLVDEAGKIDLNTANRNMILMLPGMTEDIADCILDWRDTSTSPRAQGAKDEYYLSLTPAYHCKNGPYESVDELVLVKGVTRELLYGYDRNRNGVVDERESRTGDLATSVNSGSSTALGFAPYVTVYGLRAGNMPSGSSSSAGGGSSTTQSPVDVNQIGTGQQNGQGGQANGTSQLNRAATQLKSVMTQNGISSSRADQIIERGQVELRSDPFSTVFDFYYRTSMSSDELQKVFALLTAGSGSTSQPTVKRGKVNLNTAPAEVLRCLPQLEETDVQGIISYRQSSASTDQANLWWLVTVLSRTKVLAIDDWVTGKSSCYSADIVALSPDGRAFRRERVVISGQYTPSRIIYRRDLTAAGWPLSPEIRATIRSGMDYQAPLQATGKGGL